ncbi:UDP-glucose:undecaprenyl-phosphate glucose-1-phosphate transferase [bacterium HR35]|nr:UDP-glucose:undecaprenyl-phosphate glucose-1-phosphate transferase [bacterium HR35]
MDFKKNNLEIKHKKLIFSYRVLENLIWRFLELIIAFFGLFLLIVLLPFLAIAIRLDSPGPIFYRQWRVGYKSRPFLIWKLRTMYTNSETNNQFTWTMPDDPRVTRVGRWLRRHRLDELPQVINVLKGEMSLVGPRPETVETEKELRNYIPNHEQRYEVKPGIFSLSMFQVGYVDTLDKARARLQSDLLYISQKSLRTDLSTLIRGLIESLKGHSH